eukprot:3739882-Prymnesium_polylepis.1
MAFHRTYGLDVYPFLWNSLMHKHAEDDEQHVYPVARGGWDGFVPPLRPYVCCMTRFNALTQHALHPSMPIALYAAILCGQCEVGVVPGSLYKLASGGPAQ